MIEHKHSDLVARIRAHAGATADEKTAALLSGAADVIDALAADPRKPERHLKLAVDVETAQAHAALGRLGDLMRETEEAAQRSSAAVERAKAVATTGPAALLDLADKAARLRSGGLTLTRTLSEALGALQDRIVARLAEVLT